ncbi:Mitochondrial outer membrane protein iml2 [Orbilia ellipsospora]|uniref:Mitochondrial outer membrane protein iml2 n=1 Tax=Orbilia ellipsospora TaxID=2528407 RepID=A0AAV9XRL8_9PEZI
MEEKVNKPPVRPLEGAVTPALNAPPTIWNRVGTLASLLFIGSSVFAITCMGWFAFLWWGTVGNSVWHSIVINDWAVRAISLPSSVFRIAISIQAGSCLSMLAALAIEKKIVPLPDLAAISMMRATAPGTTDTLLKLVYPLVHTAPGIRDMATLSVASLTLLVLLTSSILGFTSTILLSDVAVQPIPSYATDITAEIDFPWKNDTSTSGILGFEYPIARGNIYWKSTGPIILPAFAEYFVATEAKPAPGAVDTGVTLRAFLPFSSSDERSRVQQYKGKAVVFDARVICQKPKITNFKFDNEFDSIMRFIRGNVQKTQPMDAIYDSEPASIPFFCGMNGISICQLPNSRIGEIGIEVEKYNFPALNYGGGLKSEFSTAARKTQLGGAYLVLNNTFWFPEDDDLEAFLKGNPEWGQIGTVSLPEIEGYSTVITGTLCYTPLDVVDRDVEITRLRNSPEVAFSNYETIVSINEADSTPILIGTNSFQQSLSQLLPSENPEDRGVFTLKGPSSGWTLDETATPDSDGPWLSDGNLTDPTQLQFLVDALTLRYESPNRQVEDSLAYGNYSVALDESFADTEALYNTVPYITAGRDWQGDLFDAVMNHPNGNVALGLQAILTVIASNAYYDRLKQLTRRENISLVAFQNVSSPGGPYGTRRGGKFALEQQGIFSARVKGQFPVGYAIVAIILGVQIVLATIILIRFLRETSLTRLGDPWQALAQVASEEIDGMHVILEVSKKMNSDRNAATKEIETLGVEDTRVGIEPYAGSAKLTQRRNRLATQTA